MRDPREFVFGMEPLEKILYGEKGNALPTANAFLQAEPLIEEIISSSGAGDGQGLLKAACSLGKTGYPLSTPQCFKLAMLLMSVVPDCPLPILALDLEPLGALLQQMWNRATEREDEGLQRRIGTVYFRWFEHRQRYEDARRILAIIIENCRRHADHEGEAYAVNNFAFEYLLEGRWKEAMPLFEAAADAFAKHGFSIEYANSRANYWLCRFVGGDVTNLQEAEREVLKLKDILRSSQSRWQSRKPFILLARIEEARENFAEAIRHAEEAVRRGQGSETRYPDEDSRYLEHLRKMAKPNLAPRMEQ